MARWRFWYGLSNRWPERAARPRPDQEDLARRIDWPIPARFVVRVRDPDSPYYVDVEAYDDEGEIVVTGIAVRSAVRTAGTAELDWEEADVPPVSPRDVRRMPLDTYVRAALAVINDPLTEEGAVKLHRALRPRGGPGRGYGSQFYAGILSYHNDLLQRRPDERPIRIIAEEYGVPEPRVRQWLFRARHPKGSSEQQP
jgi:hypothetical protein